MNNFIRVNQSDQFIDENFWLVNPELKYIPVFKELYDKLGESTSSFLMWTIWVLEDRSSANKLGNLPEEVKLGSIRNYWKDYDKYVVDLERIRKYYKEYCMTPVHRTLNQLHQKLLERDAIISETPYELPKFLGQDKMGRPIMNPGTVDVLEKMIGTTQKFYQQYQQSLELFSEEEEKTQIYGGRNESLSERGDI